MPADTATIRPSKETQTTALPEEAAQTLKEVSDTFKNVGGQYMSMYSDTMAAAVEASTQTSKLISDMSKSYIDACSCSAATFAEISRESLACRTPTDIVNLQNKAVEAMKATFEATSKLYGDMFSAYSKASEPVFARVTDAPERLFRVIAD